MGPRQVTGGGGPDRAEETEAATVLCEECGKQYAGSGTCPHCVADIAAEYASEINPAAGGDPLAIAGNLFLFLALLPLMLFAWSWLPLSAALGAVGVVCHVANIVVRKRL